MVFEECGELILFKSAFNIFDHIYVIEVAKEFFKEKKRFFIHGVKGCPGCHGDCCYSGRHGDCCRGYNRCVDK